MREARYLADECRMLFFSLELVHRNLGRRPTVEQDGKSKGEKQPTTTREMKRKGKGDSLSRALAVPGNKAGLLVFNRADVKGRRQVFPEHGVYWW